MSNKELSRFTPSDWLSYFVQQLKRYSGFTLTLPRHREAAWVKQLRRLKTDEVDPYMLALALDALAAGWDKNAEEVVDNPYGSLTAGRLLRPLWELRLPREYWRAAYYSRFSSGQEVRGYRYWLSQWEGALKVEPGTEGRKRLIDECVSRLRALERKVKERPPSFELDWAKERLNN